MMGGGQEDKRSSIEEKYQSLVNGEAMMKFAGSSNGAPRSTMMSAGFPGEGGGPADVKKTFIYNQRLTTGLFEILEDRPDKEGQAREIALKVEQLFKEDYDRKQAVL